MPYAQRFPITSFLSDLTLHFKKDRPWTGWQKPKSLAQFRSTLKENLEIFEKQVNKNLGRASIHNERNDIRYLCEISSER